MTFNDPDDDRDSTPPPSGPMPGRLSLDERLRRSELLDKATRQRDQHALDKTTWTKTWKRKDEYFAELIARLTREAGTGVDEGGQLSIPGTDDLPSPPAAVDVLSGRWAELARVTPPRISAWTLQEADLSPVATKLLGLLRPEKKEEGEKTRSVTLEQGDLHKLLDCTPPAALDAAAELLCFGLARTAGKGKIATGEGRDSLLRLDSWNCDNDQTGLDVLQSMLRTELDAVHPDYLLLEVKLPRRALLPLLGGLKELGAVEAVSVDGEQRWRRVARVPLWERLLLEALTRTEGVEYQAERALEGCIDAEWTRRGLVEAGVLRYDSESAVTGQRWELVPEADRKPLDLDQVKTLVKRKVSTRAAQKHDRQVSLERLADDIELQPPTVRRACEALVAEGWLAEVQAPKREGAHYFGPWYERAEDKEEKGGKKGAKKKPTSKASGKAQAQPKKPAASKKTKAAKTGVPVRALGDDIDHVLREYGAWLDEAQLEAKVRENRPIHAQHADRDWKPLLQTMLGQERIERLEENGRTLYRIRKVASAIDRTDWRQERKEAVAHIAEQHKAGMPIGGDRQGTPRAEVLSYLEAAGALALGSKGWDYELACDIDDARVSESVWRTGLDYLLDQIEENATANGGVGPTAASLAELLEAPRGLVDDLVAELLDLNRLREVPQTLGGSRFEVLPSPKGKKLPSEKASAQKRTKPLFSDVKPAPAPEGEGEASEP